MEWHQGELFPRVGFIVTNMTAGPEGVVRFYNGRGTAEQWIKEGKYALNWTRLSCHRFVANRQLTEVSVPQLLFQECWIVSAGYRQYQVDGGVQPRSCQEGARSRESPCLQCGFTPLAEDTKTMKTDKKGGLRLQTHYLLDRQAIDMFRRT